MYNKMPSGLLPLEDDERDLQLGALFSFGYTPKQERVKLNPVDYKDQKTRSNCSFQSYAAAKGIQEQRPMSARYLTAKAYKEGLCGWDGWADLRSGAKVLQKWGCVDESELISDESISFSQYITVDFSKLDPLAVKGKIKSYWFSKNVDDVIRAIDEGFAVVIGRQWLTGMNQSGGFRYPWILERKGSQVGGHATTVIGYDLNYNNRKVDVELNSYSKNWGDNGLFYCPIDEAGKADLANDIALYGAVAFLDIDYLKAITTEDIINKFEGKNVRGDKKGSIYLIYGGKKIAYKNAEAFVAYNGYAYTQKGAFIVVPQSAIDGVAFFNQTEEKSMITNESDSHKYSDLIKYLKKPINNNFDADVEINDNSKTNIGENK
jgi:hypothetical protein